MNGEFNDFGSITLLSWKGGCCGVGVIIAFSPIAVSAAFQPFKGRGPPNTSHVVYMYVAHLRKIFINR